MSDDRELIERAAKAYWGDEIDDVCSIEWGEQDNAILYTHGENQDHNGLDQTYVWNPLADDGDALRLAVKLNLVVNCRMSALIVVGNERVLLTQDGDDAYAATRRGIVRAAAEIGKAMP